jgi:DNA-binding XRE family transcriptional regulator
MISIEMTRRREFGNRVKCLRKNCNLSRQELAERTRIPFKTIGDIERGEKVLLHVEWVVKPLADFFRLTGIGREEFFAAAGLFSDDVQTECGTQWSALLTSFYKSTTLPALVTDPLYTLHSSNAYLNVLYGLDIPARSSALYQGAGPNNLRFLFDPQFGLRQKFGDAQHWRTNVIGNLYSFRVSALRYLGTPTYERLLAELHKLPDFAALWETVTRPDYVPRVTGIPTVFYPDTPHEMQFVVAYVFPKQFEGVEQNRMIYIPADERTAAQLNRLCAGIDPTVYHYSPHFARGYRVLRL